MLNLNMIYDIMKLMNQNLKDIFKTLKENEKKIKDFKVRELSIFGSFARGENTNMSDLDFLVEFDKASFDSYMDLKFFLEDLFHTKVDLVVKKNLKERLRLIILREAVRVPGL